MIELEKTFLAKYLPAGFEKSPHYEICDTYFPINARHPTLRLRRIGNEKYELTKKTPTKEGDPSKQLEETIKLSKEEYQSFAKIKGKVSNKIRYYYKSGGQTAEITVFQGKLKGLILIDFEFKSVAEMKKFQMPDYCLADVTEEEFLAGGMVAGKSFGQLKKVLKNLNSD